VCALRRLLWPSASRLVSSPDAWSRAGCHGCARRGEAVRTLALFGSRATWIHVILCLPFCITGRSRCAPPCQRPSVMCDSFCKDDSTALSGKPVRTLPGISSVPSYAQRLWYAFGQDTSTCQVSCALYVCGGGLGDRRIPCDDHADGAEFGKFSLVPAGRWAFCVGSISRSASRRPPPKH